MRNEIEHSVTAMAPAVIVLAGPPCSLKTTFGGWLVRQLPAVHLEVDKLLTAILPASDRRLEDRLVAYDIAARGLRPVLDRNRSAILDCTYSRRVCRGPVVAGISGGDRLVVVEFMVTPEAGLRRFMARDQHDASDLTPELVVKCAVEYPYGHGSAVLDSEEPEAIVQEQLLHIVRTAQDLDRQKWVAAGL